MEMIRAAESEAKGLIEEAEQGRRERVKQAEIAVERLLDEHHSAVRKRDQDYLAKKAETSQLEREQLIAAGREKAKQMEAIASQHLENAAALVLRKVL